VSPASHPLLGDQTEGPDELCEACHLLYSSGLAHAAGGNASVRVREEIYITPTGVALGQLRPEDLVRLRLDGTIMEGGQPSKEVDLHLAMYHARAEARAILHPHPPHAIAFSARHPGARLDAIPATNAGFYVRAGQIPQLPYLRSGSRELRDAVARLAEDFYVILLGNHGLICAGTTLLDALNVCEEIEQNCRIILLAGEGARMLSAAECAEIDQGRGRTWPDPACYAEFFTSLAAGSDTA
jgi:ribulose-5-phosphate 4-epimerase/fuculose-1-phosphate aldolase